MKREWLLTLILTIKIIEVDFNEFHFMWGVSSKCFFPSFFSRKQI